MALAGGRIPEGLNLLHTHGALVEIVKPSSL
jgi:hypothetical protein